MGYQPLIIKQLNNVTNPNFIAVIIGVCLIGILFNSLPALAQTTFDPLTIGLGARALGMSGAYVAVAENSDTIFSNPAGLGEVDTFQFTSMSGKLLEEINYLLLGTAYPLGNQSALGVGYVGSFISGIEIRNAQNIFSRFANFGSSVGILSLGKKFGEKTSLGINLKYYAIDASEINEGDGCGWNVDIGILQRDLGWVSLGLVGQNLWSSSYIQYQNGEREELPLTFKLGAKMYLLGSGYRAALFSPLEFNFIAEGEWSFKKIKNSILRYGAEFSPLPFFTLRAGIIDQNLSTYGISLKLAGLSFHYAYQPSGTYFSLTFEESGWPAPPTPDTYWAKQLQK